MFTEGVTYIDHTTIIQQVQVDVPITNSAC